MTLESMINGLKFACKNDFYVGVYKIYGFQFSHQSLFSLHWVFSHIYGGGS